MKKALSRHDINIHFFFANSQSPCASFLKQGSSRSFSRQALNTEDSSFSGSIEGE